MSERPLERLQRLTVDGACNEPQPYNWRDACRLRPGHAGAHRAPIIGGWRSRWTDDATWHATEAPVVGASRKLGSRHYVRPSEISA